MQGQPDADWLSPETTRWCMVGVIQKESKCPQAWARFQLRQVDQYSLTQHARRSVKWWSQNNNNKDYSSNSLSTKKYTARKDKNSCFLDLHVGIRNTKGQVFVTYLSFSHWPILLILFSYAFYILCLKVVTAVHWAWERYSSSCESADKEALTSLSRQVGVTPECTGFGRRQSYALSLRQELGRVLYKPQFLCL